MGSGLCVAVEVGVAVGAEIAAPLQLMKTSVEIRNANRVTSGS